MRVRVWIAAIVGLAPVAADAAPASVTIAGSLQSEVGCPGDWDPTCALTALAFDASDGIWQGTLELPAGAFEYKAALNGSWDENYGANAQPSGSNLLLPLAEARSVKFYYDDVTHWVTDSVGSRIVTAAGSFQSEFDCPGDWQPECLRSWLQDADGDQVYELETTALPPGDYQTLAAVNESWAESYGAGGTPGGANIPFTVPTEATPVRFRFDGATNLLTVQVPEPTSTPLALATLAAVAVRVRRRAMLRPP